MCGMLPLDIDPEEPLIPHQHRDTLAVVFMVSVPSPSQLQIMKLYTREGFVLF